MARRRDRCGGRARPGEPRPCAFRNRRCVLPRALDGRRAGFPARRSRGGNELSRRFGTCEGEAHRVPGGTPTVRRGVGASRVARRDGHDPARGSGPRDRATRGGDHRPGLGRIRGHPRSGVSSAGDGHAAMGPVTLAAHRARRRAGIPGASAAASAVNGRRVRRRRSSSADVRRAHARVRRARRTASVHRAGARADTAVVIVLAEFRNVGTDECGACAHRRARARRPGR